MNAQIKMKHGKMSRVGGRRLSIYHLHSSNRDKPSSQTERHHVCGVIGADAGTTFFLLFIGGGLLRFVIG